MLISIFYFAEGGNGTFNLVITSLFNSHLKHQTNHTSLWIMMISCKVLFCSRIWDYILFMLEERYCTRLQVWSSDKKTWSWIRRSWLRLELAKRFKCQYFYKHFLSSNVFLYLELKRHPLTLNFYYQNTIYLFLQSGNLLKRRASARCTINALTKTTIQKVSDILENPKDGLQHAWTQQPTKKHTQQNVSKTEKPLSSETEVDAVIYKTADS